MRGQTIFYLIAGMIALLMLADAEFVTRNKWTYDPRSKLAASIYYFVVGDESHYINWTGQSIDTADNVSAHKFDAEIMEIYCMSVSGNCTINMTANYNRTINYVRSKTTIWEESV